MRNGTYLRMLLVAIPVLMVFSACALLLAEDTEDASAAGSPIDGIRYELDDVHKTAKVIPNDPKYTGAVDIPATVGAYSVTSIGVSAFDGCTGLTSVTIPSSVTSIGDYAFRSCTGLTSVTIPDGVTVIGGVAFHGCVGLTSITIPGGTLVGNSAFNGCTGLTSVTIQDGATSVGIAAFVNCTGLTSVTIPDSVKSIQTSAFQGCTGLTSVTIPDSVTLIGSDAFRGCTSLKTITITGNTASKGVLKTYFCTGGADGWKLKGMSIGFTHLIIDSPSSLSLDGIDGADGRSVTFTKESGSTTGGNFYLRNGSEALGADRAGKTFYWDPEFSFNGGVGAFILPYEPPHPPRQPVSYIVEFIDSNGSVMETMRVQTGTVLEMPSYAGNVMQGYVFAGWSYGGATLRVGDTVMMFSDTVFTPSWYKTPESAVQDKGEDDMTSEIILVAIVAASMAVLIMALFIMFKRRSEEDEEE